MDAGRRTLPASYPKKDIDVCLLRIICCFFVVMIHVSGNASPYRLALNAVSRFSVPVFIIISGRYMLAAEPDIRRILRKCLRLFLTMLLWAAVFYFYHSARGQTPAAPLPVYLLTAPVHLWYIWALMLLYLMSPILYVFCKNAGKKVYLYALGVTFLSGTVVTLLVRSGVSGTFSAVIDRAKLPYQLGFIFCFIFGDYCRRHAPMLSARAGLLLFALGSACSAACVCLVPEELLLSFFSPAAVVAAAGLYLFISQLDSRRLERMRRPLQSAADCTFGVYLMHPLLISAAENALTALGVPALLLPLLCAALVFLASLACTRIIRAVPLLKRIV